MKKIIAIILLAYLSTNAIAEIHKITITSNSQLSSNLAIKNWKFRSTQDQILVQNLTNHTIETMFYLNGKVIDDSGKMHTPDRVTVVCNNDFWYFQRETTIFCEIKSGLSFQAYIQGPDYVNGAEGMFEIH